MNQKCFCIRRNMNLNVAIRTIVNTNPAIHTNAYINTNTSINIVALHYAHSR